MDTRGLQDKSKDELIIAMLEDHVEQSIRRNLDLLARHSNLPDFLEALRTADRGYVLELGRVVIAGTPDELRRDERLQEAYLGTG